MPPLSSSWMGQQMAALQLKKQVVERASGSCLMEIVDRMITGHAAEELSKFPAGCIDLIVTSPPYWTAVEYDRAKNPWSSYDEYLADMQSVWNQCARVLRPTGKQ